MWGVRRGGIRSAGSTIVPALLLLAVNAPALAATDAIVAKAAPASPSARSATASHILDHISLRSSSVLVIDEDTGETLVAKKADAVVPVASLTKLMTALVVLDAQQPMGEMLEVTSADIDRDKRTPSRLRVGTRLSRSDLLLLSLMSSENRASMALSRNFPGGRSAFIAQMNAKAQALGMKDSRFADPAGLSSRSVSSARDLHILMTAADARPLIRDYTTRADHKVRVGRYTLKFVNSNRLVRRSSWDIDLQKTGYTNEAGRCLVMRATVAGRRLAMIFLNSFGKLTRYGDASRVRQHLEHHDRPRERGRLQATSS
jgi:serine-type D-Ala-D-Ala endopeptidase (penicillin-binding protein 7)